MPPLRRAVRDALTVACDLCVEQVEEDVALASAGGDGNVMDLLDAKEHEDPGLSTWRDYLPPKYRPQYDLAFLRQFLGVLKSVADRVRSDETPVMWSVAEELAFRFIVEFAQAVGEGGSKWTERDDDDLTAYIETAADDSDVDYLFDPRWDGIEDNESLQIVNLHFEDWFKRFNRQSQPGSGGPPPPRTDA